MDDRDKLTADCARCFGLCCVALAFSVSADFAINKAAGEPCPNLAEDFRCGIHTRLRSSGFTGCTVYDCFGAGQRVAQVTFAGRDWRGAPEVREPMFAVFGVLRQLHELLWYLAEARTLPAAEPLRAEAEDLFERTEQLAGGDPDALRALDVAAHREVVNGLLSRVSELVRGSAGGRKRLDRRGADLMGANLKGADLRGANLRGAYLIGANLTGANLTGADLIGADLRAAKLGGADLAGSIFLTQTQLNAATGNPATRIPAVLTRPAHWSS